MGSILSGRYGKRTNRGTVDDYLQLDVRVIARAGALASGRIFTLTWHGDKRRGREPVHLTGLAERDSVSFHDGGQTHTLRLYWTRCTLGGRRPFFRCPRCYGRFCILYRAGGYACRSCLRLVYPVERESRRDRTMRRARKVMGRVGYEERRKYGKPKWMRWRTFWRLCEDAERASDIEDAADAPFRVLNEKARRRYA